MAYRYILFYVVKTEGISTTLRRTEREYAKRIRGVSDLALIEAELLEDEQEKRRTSLPPGMENSIPELSVELTGMLLLN